MAVDRTDVVKAEFLKEYPEYEDSDQLPRSIKGKLDELLVSAVETIMDELNGGNPQDVARVMLGQITKSHRFLQGEFWSSMLKVIKQYGELEHFDPRNEFAVKMCKRMAEAGEYYE